MPGWVTHVAAAWILGKLLNLKCRWLDNAYIAVLMVGSLIPDLVKIALLFDLLQMNAWPFLKPLHTPFGSLLVAGLASLLFENKTRIFLLLALGLSSHFALDALLMHVSGGIGFLFPFSWSEYQLGLIRSDDYHAALVSLLLAGVVYVFHRKCAALKSINEAQRFPSQPR